jgi:hypothetical protein
MKPHGNGSSKGYVDLITAGPGWLLMMANASDPPPPDELPLALSQALEHWLREERGVRVRSTLGIVRHGHTVGIHVWYDPAGGDADEFPS